MPAIDPRIGELMRMGQTVHYAFLGQDYREGAPEALSAWLDGIEIAAEPAASVKPSAASGTGTTVRGRDYVVNVSVKHPAWNDHPFDKTVFARTARDAEKQVRDWMWNQGLHTRLDGPLIVKARRDDVA